MIFVGDVHGEFRDYAELISKFDRTIQVGDMGIGFGRDDQYVRLIGHQHRFIRGNHDNPQLCKQLPQYMGDFGYWEDDDLFFVSGAYSPDFYVRTPHVTWWEDEELCTRDMNEALDLYAKVKPSIVATHDCPRFLYNYRYNPSQINENATAKLFDAMFDIHRPRAWVFGHHHRSKTYRVRGTLFVMLASLEVCDLTEVPCES